MSNMYLEKLLEKRKQLLNELSQHPTLLHGTWVERYNVCSRPNCKCHRGEKHGPHYHIAVMEEGKQRQHYIRLANKDLALAGLKQNESIENILREITKINLELMKEGIYEDK